MHILEWVADIWGLATDFVAGLLGWIYHKVFETFFEMYDDFIEWLYRILITNREDDGK